MSIRDLAPDGRFIVRQKIEKLEAITGFETRNHYELQTSEGQAVMWAYEESAGLSRIFLKKHRPLTLHVAGRDGRDFLVASRKFFWFFMHLRVHSSDGRPIGAIRRKWGLLKRKMVIEDASGEVVADVAGPVFRPNTFTMHRHDQEIGKITKRWSGIGREMFTDADTFMVELPTDQVDDDFQSLALATAFAVDLDFFENK